MINNLNILFLNSTFPVPENGGTERVIDNLSYHFKKCGHFIFVGFFEGLPGVNSNIIDCINLKSNRRINSDGLVEFIYKNKIDVIINFNTTLPYFIIKVLKKSKVKIISTLNFDPLNYLKVNSIQQKNSILKYLKKTLGFILFKYQVNKILKLSSKYVILSDYSFNDLKLIAKEKYLNKVIAINNINFIDNINYNFLGYKENKILYVGRMKDQNKRLYLLLDIWKILFEKLDDKSWELNMVGSGKDLIGLKDYVKYNKIQNVIFYGKSDPVNFYKKAKIFLMTSIAEGFPNSLLESQIFGCVPIAFNTFSSVNDIIIDDFNGKLIQSDNIDSYVNSIIELIENNDKYLYLQKNSIDFITKFDAINIIPKWNNLLEEIINT